MEFNSQVNWLVVNVHKIINPLFQELNYLFVSNTHNYCIIVQFTPLYFQFQVDIEKIYKIYILCSYDYYDKKF